MSWNSVLGNWFLALKTWNSFLRNWIKSQNLIFGMDHCFLGNVFHFLGIGKKLFTSKIAGNQKKLFSVFWGMLNKKRKRHPTQHTSPYSHSFVQGGMHDRWVPLKKKRKKSVKESSKRIGNEIGIRVLN